ncbi:hypothetical protein [Ruegeria marina]|uniref:Uncharacterized protein n=1 Tax=Ruegeria marina TaxID=639004 RepID=A0A1G6IC96_9RHOB|nr:hypothetical protein [Ruegeria marina]SDC03625.1 hypothetical protein SAMN04488239_10173 [Ruegeria marina]
MTNTLSDQPTAWFIAILALAACWPIAQALRHEKLHPLAAYLLFTSLLVLVSAAAFWILIRVASTVFAPGALDRTGFAVAIILLSLAPGFAAARWIVRRPQWRRMPK